MNVCTQACMYVCDTLNRISNLILLEMKSSLCRTCKTRSNINRQLDSVEPLNASEQTISLQLFQATPTL